MIEKLIEELDALEGMRQSLIKLPKGEQFDDLRSDMVERLVRQYDRVLQAIA